MQHRHPDHRLQEQVRVLLHPFPELAEGAQLLADLTLLGQRLAPHPAAATLLPGCVQAVALCVDPQRAVNHFLRYLDNTADPLALWTLCAQYPQSWPILTNVLASSHLLSSILWRSPQLLCWLLDKTLWAPPPTPEDLLQHLWQEVAPLTDDTAVAMALRTFTSQHLLRIGARDLAGLADVEETTADLSALADCVVHVALATCQARLTALHGTPWYSDDTGAEQPCGFCVIGMGKLGGYELNFSSDIDLMYVYTSYQGQTRGIPGADSSRPPLSNHEYFVTLARRLTTMVGGQGPDGQAFRVDLRLRPEGTQGQVALSLLSYEAYYARLGQPWERMALLKARPIAGDRHLGQEFLALVHPFVYQRHLDPAGVRQIQSMKQQIDAQIADKAQAFMNVKLGLGGIREIEFLIQIPQLLFGGRIPALQQRHSLRALAALQEAGFLTPEVAATLRDTYCYLRRVEHRVQMEQGAQTHTLPRRPEQQMRLARQFGYTTWEAFYQDYLERTAAVHAIFVEAFDSSLTAGGFTGGMEA